MRVTTDQGNAAYEIGETVRFTVTLLRDGQPVAAPMAVWTISKDGKPPRYTGRDALTPEGLT